VWGAITGAFSAFGPGAKATIIIVLVLALLLLPVTVLLLLLLLIAVVIVAIVRAVRRLLNPRRTQPHASIPVGRVRLHLHRLAGQRGPRELACLLESAVTEPCRVPELGCRRGPAVLGCTFVLVDQAAKDGAASDSLLVKVRGGMVGAWWEKSLRPMWSPTVVMGAVLGEDGPQVPFTEDQDAVGEFGSGGQYESFGEAVRSRAAWRDLHGVDARVGQDGVERGGELAGPVADEEAECGGMAVEVHQQVPGCWVVHAPVGWLVAPRMCT
jgi:hypothetical protein